jgi:predicted nucleic acid-binding protein
MTLTSSLAQYRNVFIDTSPIIYFLEAHPLFGPPAKEIFTALQNGTFVASTSVLTLTEVLVKPVERGDLNLARTFSRFLRTGVNFSLIEITEQIAEEAGYLCGSYPFLKTVDSLQIVAATDAGADVFLTNDKKLRQISEIPVLVLADFV